MADEIRKEITFPLIPKDANDETRRYLLRLEEVIREVFSGPSYSTLIVHGGHIEDGTVDVSKLNITLHLLY
jgi:hypothetical protein